MPTEARTTDRAARYLYLARHGEASADETALTEKGRRQAVLLGERLRSTPLSAIHHGPLPRAEQTARLIGEQCADVPLRSSELAGDYLPYLPQRQELPEDAAGSLLGFLGGFTEAEREHGPALARQALAAFTGPVEGGRPRHELVVTHNFLVGWLVRAALDAPEWRWMGLNHGNAALTVIRYAPGRPSSVLVHNDMRHLPADLRWTGFPPELQV
ncbi:histidine phosphatase family protein [Pseudonocardia xinjiangensis]|uniref:histidine phosphatase family protein n=1 Tax=Pseudonocardia xinjiangensis TaxID=75289 RepID=UPI003D93B82C